MDILNSTQTRTKKSTHAKVVLVFAACLAYPANATFSHFPTPPPSSPAPTMLPTSSAPTMLPSSPAPSPQPSSHVPTALPTPRPSSRPTPTPTARPSPQPSPRPTFKPSSRPTQTPTLHPSFYPTAIPLPEPSAPPTLPPSPAPTPLPTLLPSPAPSSIPSSAPSGLPSQSPSPAPSSTPSAVPTPVPTGVPTPLPTETGIYLIGPTDLLKWQNCSFEQSIKNQYPGMPHQPITFKVAVRGGPAQATCAANVKLVLPATESGAQVTQVLTLVSSDDDSNSSSSSSSGSSDLHAYEFALWPGTYPSSSAGWLCTNKPLQYSIYCGSFDYLQSFDLTILNASIEFTRSPTHVPSSSPSPFPTRPPTSPPTPAPNARGGGGGGGGGGDDNGVIPGFDDDGSGLGLGSVGGVAGFVLLCLAAVLVCGVCVVRQRGELKHRGCWPKGNQDKGNNANRGRYGSGYDSGGSRGLGYGGGGNAEDEAACFSLKCVWLWVCGRGVRFGSGGDGDVILSQRNTLDDALQRMGVRDNYLIPREDLELEARPFASGGGGQVYRGTYNGTLVAAKSVFSQSLTTQLDEFNREVKMLATLAHPNIVTFYGVSRDGVDPSTLDESDLRHLSGGMMFIVEEFCGGGSLEAYCVKTHPHYALAHANYTPADFSRIVTGLLAGVRYMHSQGIAHRDLKPANVLLTQSGHVKLADLGLARNFQNTVVTAGVGTPAFMPPEAFDDNETEALFFNASHWDIYALGVLVWSLWFRRDPWPRTFSAHKIMAAVTRGRRPPFEMNSNPATSGAPPPPPPPASPPPLRSSHPPPPAEAAAGAAAAEAPPGAATAAAAAAPPAPAQVAAAVDRTGLYVSSGGWQSGWGELSAALPPPPALRALIEQMWSQSHAMRGEVKDLTKVFTTQVSPYLLPCRNMRLGSWEKKTEKADGGAAAAAGDGAGREGSGVDALFGEWGLSWLNGDGSAPPPPLPLAPPSVMPPPPPTNSHNNNPSADTAEGGGNGSAGGDNSRRLGSSEAAGAAAAGAAAAEGGNNNPLSMGLPGPGDLSSAAAAASAAAGGGGVDKGSGGSSGSTTSSLNSMGSTGSNAPYVSLSALSAKMRGDSRGMGPGNSSSRDGGSGSTRSSVGFGFGFGLRANRTDSVDSDVSKDRGSMPNVVTRMDRSDFIGGGGGGGGGAGGGGGNFESTNPLQEAMLPQRRFSAGNAPAPSQQKEVFGDRFRGGTGV